ncbi:discoidin domain-containing protein [Paenibacillus plantarum]|nr:discoidin domain-containing protein [Paenibacillus plantarum]
MVKKFRKITSVALATAMIVTSMFAFPTNKVEAQQVSGNAPFINSWLVSGPFVSPVVDQIYGTTVEETVKYAATASQITASSSTLAVNPVSKLVDGSTSSQWVTENDSAPWVDLKWSQPIAINEVKIAQWGDGRHVNNYYHLTFTLNDGSKVESGKVDSTSSSSSAPTLYAMQSELKNVVEVKVEIDKGRTPYPSITGISEIEVNNKPAVGSGSGAATIAPAIGDLLSLNNESNKWEYFDDRIYNRNYDDYQDLYGYYAVKKGVDTRNKYVYAHTYVYSPVEQQAYFNVGASGSYRLYVNDKAVTTPSIPVEVQKDLTKQAILLKQGWNKLMIQIKHTYTEDVNSNNVPTPLDQNVAYLGFYGRVADQNGNKINGLVQTVKGEAAALEIVTQGLSTEDDIKSPLPTQNMPIGYKEWPYVWNKSKGGNKYGVAASAFQFMASGGAPGYTWSIVDGKLPDGLALNADGTIADGLVNGNVDLNSSKGIISINAAPGDYNFTVQVTDLNGNTSRKNMTITVKERPNKWFEEGRVGALSHAAPIYQYFVDPNFSADLWAERAKAQGHSLVSVESVQQAYFWPSKFADPKNDRHIYLPKDENGKVVDGLKQFELAVKRYGMKFGLYYGGGVQVYTTDLYVQNLTDLITRYTPAYLYFDGPQGIPDQNFDVIYSTVRNLSDDIIVNSNAWGAEYGDPDLRTEEASGIYANGAANHLLKRTTMEPWKMIHTKDGLSPYYGKRDDYRQVAKEMVMNVGRGYVDNNDQTPVDSRGPNWNSPEEIATRYPKAEQEYIDVRESLAAWFAPEGKPERHESTTGTMPYFLSGYGYEDDGKGNAEKFALPNSTTGPQWGYAMYRDNNVYLHIIKGPDSKKGFDAILGKSLTIRPVPDHVTSVTWLNEDIPVTSFVQNGESLTVNLANVQEDPIDTIIKIVTDNSARRYSLTNVKVTGEQLTPSSLKINTEGYMTFPALKAKLSGLTYNSTNPAIAVVNANGIVTPVSNGTTTITVSGTYEGVTKQDTLKVTARDGKIYVGENMIGATLLVDGKEAFGEVGTLDKLSYQIEGRSSKGGAIGLDAAQIQWHGGVVDLKAGDNLKPVSIRETNEFTFKTNEIIAPFVQQPTRGVVWADVTLDGKTFTTNKIFMDLLPYQNLAATEITASHNQGAVSQLVDGKTIDGIHFDQFKWSVPASEKSWIQFKLPTKSQIANINLNFNSLEQNYINTPKTIKIQTSADGVAWTDVKTVNGPTGTANFGFYNQYAVNTEAQYVKLLFDGGSNGSTIDLLEVAINGVDTSNLFDRIDYAYKPVTAATGKYDIKAFTGAGAPMDMKDAVITVTSENQGVITVGDSNLLTAVSKGIAKIHIRVTIGGRSIEEVTYLSVDESGKIVAAPYLSKIDLTLNKNTIKLNNPIFATFNGLLSTGGSADLSSAAVEYQFSDARLSVVEGSNTIIAKGELGTGFNATVAVKVTLDGVAVISRPMTISVVVDTVPQSKMTATATSQETAGDNNAASMAVDGNPGTIWHTKWNKSDALPQSITLNLGGTYKINKVSYLPRQSGGSNGIITSYNVYVSTDGVSFTKVASGNWDNNSAEKYASFTSANASYVKLEATAGVGGFASAAEINVCLDSPEVPQAVIAGPVKVNSGQTFNLTMGLTGVTQSVYQQVYAQDFTLQYDPASVNFETVTSLKDGFRVIDQKETAPGQLRIVAASVGTNVTAQGDFLAIKFTAKSVAQATNTTISIDHVVIANAQGNELQVGGASREIQITVTTIPVDKSLLNATIASAQSKYDAAVEGNGDGLYAIGSKAQLQSAIDAAKVASNASNATQQHVDSAKAALEAAIQVFISKKITSDVNTGGVSIGDLAVVAAAYGKQQGQVGWNEKADVNHDGIVDIIDLAIIAKAILQ